MDELIIPLALGCAVALLSALGVIALRRPVHSAMLLLVHSVAIAALFLMLAADLAALGQVVIYSGAIVVLFLFVVALLPAGGREGAPGWTRFLAGLLTGAAMLVALASAFSVGTPPPVDSPPTGPAPVGRALFGPLLVPFELTAPLLLVAVVGAVAIWRRQERPPREQPR